MDNNDNYETATSKQKELAKGKKVSEPVIWIVITHCIFTDDCLTWIWYIEIKRESRSPHFWEPGGRHREAGSNP